LRENDGDTPEEKASFGRRRGGLPMIRHEELEEADPRHGYRFIARVIPAGGSWT
jgi:hypothetical protein